MTERLDLMSSRIGAPLAGIAAGAVTLGVAELLALALARSGNAGGTPSPLLAVGGGFVDRTPPWLKDLAVDLFGTADKIALFVGMGATLALVCAVLGVVTTRWRTTGLVLFALVGVVGSLAVLTRPNAAALDVAPTVLGTLAGLGVLAWLARGAARSSGAAGAAADSTQSSPSRRGVLVWGAGLTVLGAAGMYLGRTLGQAAQVVEAARADLRGRVATGGSRTPVTIPADADFEIDGLASYVTPNETFYRIDTALSVPQVDPGTWSIRVHGMVDTEVELTFDELLDEELIDTVVTLCCVSNEVGGNLIGNARWTGLPIRELLSRAGVQGDADMVLSTSADGFTAGTPLEALTDDRDAILAVGMNDEPLPAEHGFPVRMVVPGLYGYVSATKWVVDLEVTRFDQDQGYWTPRGWSPRGPIKVQSRIDVPRGGSTVQSGSTVIAGVAWDQQTGIERVEVRVDGGQWQEAELADAVSADTWRQWRLPWDATSGEHTIVVRATNKDGETQTPDLAPPAPDGATGWHTIDVTVA
ncbi:MAG: molybdopterin-dependent oxidoreductase [Ornithinimicrobium sp.]|uniref:molybdopterin-dependent oxidoreductase n=1 Tax=Ornithinimicrobium sp. TaxID=1977084 RepID=UPI003D9B8698